MREEDINAGVAFLRRTPFLDAIRTDGLDRTDLRERFDVSRSTAYRTTVDLEERGLIEPTNAGYRLTPYGLTVVKAGERYVETLSAAERLQLLLEYVDHPLLADSLYLFADSEVITPEPDEPFRLIEWLMDRMTSVERYRSLVPTVGTAEQFDIPEERAEAGADMEVVFTHERLSGWAGAARERLAATLGLPNCNGFVAAEEPFPLQIFDETVMIVGVDDEDGLPKVCVATERVEARDWAEAVFRRHRRRAEPVDVESLVA